MNVITTTDGSHSTVILEGEMTIYTAADLKNSELFKIIADSETVDVDLGAVSEIDTSGLQLMVVAKNMAVAKKKTLSYINHSQSVLSMLDLCNMASYFGDPMVISSSLES